MLTTTSCSNNKAMKKPTNTKRVGPLSSIKSKPMKNMSTTNKPPQQQPLKVVYISNPMRIQATPSQFRALVQQLTGQDAVDWSTPSPSSSPNPSSSLGPQKHLSRDVVSENDVSSSSNSEVRVPNDVSRVDDYDSVKLSCWFGSDLGCFGPLDGDYELVHQDDRTVDVDNNNELEMSLIYEYLQQS